MYNSVNKNEGIFTSIVRVKGNSNYKVVPVRSSEPVSKELWIELSKVIGRIYVSVPIEAGNIVCKNILNTGIDVICTRDIYVE